jgi:DNA repair photolyase
LQKKREQFFVEAPERKDILERLADDCIKMRGDRRPILLCFVCDPYQPHDEKVGITRQALEILEFYDMTAQILTKGGMRAVRDFDILKRAGWKFGTTLSFSKEESRQEWEPGAASIESRTKAILEAKERGIFTWVSVEPVIDPEQALNVIDGMLAWVDYWKVGKLNHHKEQERSVNWSKFVKDVRLLLKDRPHYIKTDLLAWEKSE